MSVYVDWKLVDRASDQQPNGLVALGFQRVRWMRAITDQIATPPPVECDFDHPDAYADEIEGRMVFTVPVGMAGHFVLGKTYRATFG